MKPTPHKKARLRKTLPHLISLAAGGAAGFLIARYSGTLLPGHSFLSSVLFLLLFALGFLVQIIIHEAGHLVCGLLSGYSFSSFRVLNFMWVMLDGKLRFKRLSIAGTGGQCLMSPPDLTDGHLPTVLYNLGGVLANCVFSLGFWGLSRALSQYPFLSASFLLFAAAGALIALTNGIPIRTNEISNDGFNALWLGKSPQALRAFWIQMKVCEQTALGVRLRDMPDEWFTPAADESLKNGIIVVPSVFACNRLMDAQQFDEADRLMQHLLSIKTGMAGLHRCLMLCDRLYIHLVTKNPADIPEDFLSSQQMRFMQRMKRFPSVLRTQYAYALLHENDNAKAQRYADQFERCAASYPYSADIESERELMATAKACFSAKL